MIDLNIANFITIGLIAVVGYAGMLWLLNMFGINTNWLQGSGSQ